VLTVERCHRAGDDGATRRHGSTVHTAYETLGHLLTVVMTPADAQDRAHVGTLAAAVQDVTGSPVEVAFVDHGDTGEKPAQAAYAQRRRVQVVTVPETTRGVVVLPRQWVVERRVAWTTRCRRLARDSERWPVSTCWLVLCSYFIVFPLFWFIPHTVQNRI
jgi:transposase